MHGIQIKSPALTIKAGPRALERIKANGLTPSDVGILPGAAGGPKALGIQGLDLALFGDWLARAPRERALIGASIGSWRFASACLPDAAAGIRRLGELYNDQHFSKDSNRAEVSASCRQMLADLLEAVPVAAAAGREVVAVARPAAQPLRVPPEQLARDAKLLSLLRGAVIACEDEDGWAKVGAVGTHIANKASFDARNYGYATLTKLLAATGAFDMRDEGSSRVSVRDKRHFLSSIGA